MCVSSDRNDTNASVSIVDLSSLSECALSYQFIQRLAERNPTKAGRQASLFPGCPGGARLWTMPHVPASRGSARPLPEVVHTLGEAFVAIPTQVEQFEPSSPRALFQHLPAEPVHV